MKYPDSVLIWIHIFTLCVAEETTKLEGDIIIGGLFKIFDLKDGACSNTVDTASVRDYEAVKWTLKKLNAANYIPGINIGIEAFSTCDIPGRAVYHTVNFVQKAFENHANSSSLPIVGILGPEASSEAEETSAFLSSLSKEYQLYQFLFSATSSNLNDERLSNIVRVIPSDTIQTKVMQHFLKQLEWNYVAVVYENTTYGRTAFEELSSSAKFEGICIAKSFPIETGITVDFSALQTVLDNLLSNAESQITGVIFFVSTTTASDFLSIVQGRKQGSFFRLMMVFSESIALERSMLKNYDSVSKGTFVTSPPVLEVKEFSNHWNSILSNKTSFLDEYVTNPWLLNVLRKYISCDPFQETCLMPTLQEVSTSENENIFEGYAIVAALLQVNGIKELHSEKCKGSDGICTELRETLHKHKNMLFKKSSREVIFQDVPFHFEKNFSIILNGKNEVLMNGNISAYEVYQYRRCLDKNEDFCLEKVADYGENSLKVLTGRLVDYSDNNNEIQWPNMYKAQCSLGRNCKSCKVENTENDIYFKNGDFFIIGMAPVNTGDLSNPLHCDVIRESNGWECTEAISYAVDDINQNKDVFPNSTIGFIILNSCNQPVLTSKKLLNIMNNGVTLPNGTVVHDVSSRVLGVVAELGSSISQAAAEVLQEFNIVQVAYGSTAAVLSNREEYKYFLRLSTPDTNQAVAMVDISKKLDLKYIQILFSEGTYGEGGRDDVIRAAKSSKVCVANEIIVQENKYSMVLDDLRRNPYAKVVLLFLKSHVVSEVIEVITRSMDAEEFVFIASEAFGTRTEIIENNPKLENSLSLSLEIPLSGNNLKGYIYSKSTEKYYLNPWTRSFLEKKNACFFPGSFDKSSNEQCEKVFDRYNSSDIKYDIWSPFALHAAKVVLNGAYASFRHICGLNSKTICSEYRDNPKRVWEYFQRQNLSLNGVQTSIFDDNGDGNLGHVIYQIKKSRTDPKVLEFVKVGSFSQSTKLNLSRIDTINPTECQNQKCKDYCTLFYNGNAKDEKETSNDSSNTGVVVGLSVVAAIFVFSTIALIIYILIIRRVDPTEFSMRNEYLTVVK